MMNLNSEREVKARVMEMLEKFQSRFNRGRFDDLEKLFASNIVLAIGARRKQYVGRRSARDYWKSLKRKGVKNLQIHLMDMKSHCVEEIVRTEKGFQKFDLIVDIVCRLDYFNSPNPVSQHAYGRAGHMDDCNFGLRSIYMG